MPLVEVTGPPLDAHPFPAMAQQLGHDPATIDVMKLEPLARAAPSDFWYARVDDIRLMLRLMDEADAWITPVAQILQQNPEDRRLSQRYQEQLGLRRSGLAKALGHTVVGAIAIVGSDPYLREGSDVTMIFTVKQRAVLEAELGRHLEAYRAEVPGIAASVELYEGVELRVAKDPAGRVRQHRASFSDASGDLELVSNSPAALRRVLDALAGRSPQLAGEDDLKYMLVRDQGVHEVFAFLSDKFIAAVVGPRQKILAARRQLALSELLVPGYAALLHGWLYGQAPATSEALVASRLLAEDELRHDDGDPITFTPGAGARSKWGRPAALTPLIDMPTPALVTVDERDAYDRFTQTYQTYWKRFIDPVAVRLDITEVAGRESARVDVRVLPLISATDYSDIAERVGDTRIDVPPLSPQFGGLTAIWAVGADARLRGDLNRLLRGATGQSKLGIDWLGAWVMAGVADRAAGVELLSYVDETVQLRAPERKDNFFDDLEVWKLAGKFPVFLAADVKNPAALVATLAAVRAMLGEVAPGVVDWGEHSQHRELPIVRIGMNPKTPMLINREQAEAVAIYYAQTGGAIVLALDPEVLKTVIDRLLDGEAPTHKEGAREGGQFVIDVRSDPGRPLWTAALWAVQGQADDAQRTARRSAEILLRGQPSVAGDPSALAALGLAYFGSAPLTAHGGHDFKLSPDGVGDPVQGTREQPIFGDLPYPGSPVETLMRRFSGLRGEVSFDAEPTAAGHDARSLHTTFTLRLGKGE
ncbi:MAG: hypothetical protein KC636_28005 [Myxococcales bacterium]|nr:hypothetical protein [Myxococcales bacterium]